MASKSLLTIVFLQGCGAALSFSLVISLTKILGVTGYGMYAWVVSLGSIGSLLAQAGLPMTISKAYTPLSQKAVDVPSELSATYLIYMAASIGLLLLAIVFQIAWANFPLILWALPVGASLASMKIGCAILVSQGRAVAAQSSEQLLRVATIFFVLGGSVWLGFGGAPVFLSAYSLGAIAAPSWHLAPLISRAVPSLSASFKIVPAVGSHFQVGISRSIGSFLPVFIAGIFIPAEQLAYLAVAIQLTGPLEFGLVAARSFYGFKINKAIKNGDNRVALIGYRSAIMFSNAVSWILGLILLLLILLATSTQQFAFILSGFSDRALLLSVFVGVLIFRVAHAFFGPAQLIAIFLGEDKFVRDANVTALVAFTVSLFVVSGYGSVVLVPAAMTAYTFLLIAIISARTFSRLR